MKTKTILIAEDNQALLLSYKRVLGHYFKVFTASSVNTAIGVLCHDLDGEIDAVVSDYDLGDGTGADILRWVKGNRPDLPFYLCTGNQSVDLGVPTFSKPFDIQELRKVIETRL